nr:MAG TPA: hypothetical protein [Caudoviricetes sp.]
MPLPRHTCLYNEETRHIRLIRYHRYPRHHSLSCVTCRILASPFDCLSNFINDALICAL